jgi:signal peptidase I
LQVLTALGLGVALFGFLFPGFLVVQAKHTQSVPFTLAFALSQTSSWRQGDLVQFLTPDLPPYFPAGSRFVKTVAAVPGDRLTRLGRDFYVNGHYLTTARPTDSKGRPAPLFSLPPAPIPMSVLPSIGAIREAVCRPVLRPLIPSDALFVLGAHERSYDSRYWGLVPLPRVTGRVVTIF